ncbi:MAG: Rpn family recombination-promoting nuclease/putative transposase [Bacteroidota bacterium]
MSEQSAQNPHDHFFKVMFSRKEVVRKYCENFLPEELSRRLVVSELVRVPDSFVDEELKDHFSDIIYCCPLDRGKHQVLITLLFEHKSYVPPFPHLQLLQYLLNGWKSQRNQAKKNKQKKFRLRPIIPIIVYHGREKWNVRPFTDYFEGEWNEYLTPYLPDFNYHLTDLTTYSPEELATMDLEALEAAFLAFQISRNEELFKQFFGRIQFYWQYFKKNESYHDLSQAIVVYLIRMIKKTPMEVKAMIQYVRPTNKPKEDWTLEDYLIEEFEKKNNVDFYKAFEDLYEAQVQVQKAEARAKEAELRVARSNLITIKTGLKLNLPMETLMEMTQLSRQEVKKIIAQIKKEEE